MDRFDKHFTNLYKDVVIAVLCSTVVTFVILLFLPLLHKRPAFGSLLKVLVWILLMGVVVSLFVFPYSKDTPKRVFIQHSTNEQKENFLSLAGWDANVIDSSFFGGNLFGPIA